MAKEAGIIYNEILARIASIYHFAKWHTLETFEEDEKTIAACTMYLQVIWEQAWRFTKYCSHIPTQMPLPQMIGMRNIISHDYANVFAGELWATITNDLPALEKIIKQEMELTK